VRGRVEKAARVLSAQRRCGLARGDVELVWQHPPVGVDFVGRRFLALDSLAGLDQRADDAVSEEQAGAEWWPELRKGKPTRAHEDEGARAEAALVAVWTAGHRSARCAAGV
jgi:hypothetical protein